MKKYIYCVICIVLVSVTVQAGALSNVRLEQQIKTRTVSALQHLNSLLIAGMKNKQMSPAQLRVYLRRGAEPCRALPFAVFADNAAAVAVLAEFKNRCSWNDTVRRYLPLAMQKDRNELFDALMQSAPEVTCPDPFDYTPAPQGAAWKPLSARMLVQVNNQCFKTRQARADFLRSIILLNSRPYTSFTLAEAYSFGIHSVAVRQQWLGSVAQLVRAGVPVSTDTLLEVITGGRAHTCEGLRAIPFDVTRVLVQQSVKGGANGQEVLAYLNSSKGAWVRELYSPAEQIQLITLLGGKIPNSSVKRMDCPWEGKYILRAL